MELYTREQPKAFPTPQESLNPLLEPHHKEKCCIDFQATEDMLLRLNNTMYSSAQMTMNTMTCYLNFIDNKQ